jgi:hypothetical protein
MGIRNIWSLTVDEALVISEIRQKLGKDKYEVFLPANSQLKDIDLILMNLERMEPITLQVKGSRTWEATEKRKQKYGDGSSAWIQIGRKSIRESSYRIDFFIFVFHNLVDTTEKGVTKKQIKINYLIIPANELGKRIYEKKRTIKGDIYNFFIWIDDKGKRAFDFTEKGKKIEFSDFLDNWDILKQVA